jgi:hypothetical protein
MYKMISLRVQNCHNPCLLVFPTDRSLHTHQRTQVGWKPFWAPTVSVLRFGSIIAGQVGERWGNVVDSSQQEDVSEAERGGTADESRDCAHDVDQVSNPAVDAYSEDRVEY